MDFNFPSLFSSNMHSYNGSNMGSMHHGGHSHPQEHDVGSGHPHSASTGSGENNGSSSADSKTLSPPPSSASGAAGYATYFGQLAANSAMDNVMCRPVH